ncbi:hypothetical protein [Thermopirellula anaerolimosa]
MRRRLRMPRSDCIPADGFLIRVSIGMDVLRWFMAFAPVAIYLMIVGGLNLARRPVLLTGTQDRLLLGLSLVGLIIVGPMELFLPMAAYIYYGGAVWLILVILLALAVGLVILTAPPRLVVFNTAPHQLRAIVAETAIELDAAARWAGDCLVLPGLGIQLVLVASPGWRNVTLSAIGPHQDYLGWRTFGRALAGRLAATEVPPNPRGLVLVAAGLTLLVAVSVGVFQGNPTVAAVLNRVIPF